MPAKTSKFAQIDDKLSETAARGQCGLCHWLGRQSRVDQEYLTELMRLPVTVRSHRHIADMIADPDSGGPVLPTDTIANHRKKHLS
jgi:hypothetical protein